MDARPADSSIEPDGDRPDSGKARSAAGRWAAWVVARPRWVIAVTMITTAFLAAGMAFLSYDPSSRIYLGSDNPRLLQLREVEKRFSQANSVQIIIAPKDGQLFTNRVLLLIEDLTEAAWQIPHAFRVDSLALVQRAEVDPESIAFSPLYTDAASLGDADLSELRDLVLNSPHIAPGIVSPDGDVTEIVVLVQPPETDVAGAIFEIADAAKSLAFTAEEENPEVEIRLSGGVIADIAFAEASRRDMQLLVPLMLGLAIGVLAFGFRTWTDTLASVLVVAASAAIGMGLGGALGFSINASTAGAPLMIMTLAVADCVHLLTSRAQYENDGCDRREALIRSVEVNFLPIVITTLSTAVGFLTLNFSESPPLRELGNFVAIGQIAALVLSLTLLPAFRLCLPSSRRSPPDFRKPMATLAAFVVRRNRSLLLLFLLTLPAALIGITQLRINDNVVEYFDDSFAFRRDTDFLEDHSGSFHKVLFALDSREDGGIVQPDYLRKVDAFATWLSEQPNVANVVSIAGSLTAMHRLFTEEDDLPPTAEAAAEYLLLLEMSQTAGQDLGNITNISRSASLVAVGVSHADSRRLEDLGQTAEAWLKQNMPDLATVATGLSIAYADVTVRNIRAMLSGTLTSLVVVSLIMLVVVRNLRIGVLSLFPNLLPAMFAFGVWGYAVGEVNLAISVIGAMTFGIVVDDTAHFLTRYSRARKAGHDHAQSVQLTMQQVGPALVLSTLTLVLGFSVLGFSGFSITSLTGLMSALTIGVALAADLLFLPPLLGRLGPKYQANQK